jgi:hypothetical protein
VSNASDIAVLPRPSLKHVVLAGGVYDGRKRAWVFPDSSLGYFAEVLFPLHADSPISHFKFVVADAS